MAVRTPSGRTLPGNLAIIPSEQSWVFHAIYQHVFSHLYSSKVCSRNCLVFTNKDEAEYRSFEALIKTTSDFKQSTVMLCTFHGVLMAFKKDLLTLLEDCDCGKVYGKLVYCCINWYIRTFVKEFICTNSYYFLFLIHVCHPRGVVIQAIHASRCVFENKDKYDMSNKILTNVISDAFTKGHIKQPLKEAIEAFQIKLNNKRRYLAFYIRKSIHNCYDAMTTSPCESMNSHIKHTSKASTLNNTR